MYFRFNYLMMRPIYTIKFLFDRNKHQLRKLKHMINKNQSMIGLKIFQIKLKITYDHNEFEQNFLNPSDLMKYRKYCSVEIFCHKLVSTQITLNLIWEASFRLLQNFTFIHFRQFYYTYLVATLICQIYEIHRMFYTEFHRSHYKQ